MQALHTQIKVDNSCRDQRSHYTFPRAFNTQYKFSQLLHNAKVESKGKCAAGCAYQVFEKQQTCLATATSAAFKW